MRGPGEKCVHPGCPQHVSPNQSGCGRGYCGRHYRNVLRYGDPEGAGAKARWELREAALAWTDKHDERRVQRLVKAAVALGLVRSDLNPRVGRAITLELIVPLCVAAEGYGWAESDQDFAEAEVALFNSAKVLYRAVVVRDPGPLIGLRRGADWSFIRPEAA
jgi:hypothetical protein